MDYTLPIRTFIATYFKIDELSGAEKFLILSANVAKGDTNVIITPISVKKIWQKGLLKLVHHRAYNTSAQVEGWIKSVAVGKLALTQKGIDHLQMLANMTNNDPLDDSTKLHLFSAKQSHSFDKTIREALALAKQHVRIADSYVDETIFDNTLDQIPTGVTLHLMYSNNPGLAFDTRVVRFKQEYSQFTLARNTHLHDRFLIVDDTGFIIGPSLKDAANRSPALLMRLNKSDTAKLTSYFDNMYKNIPKQ